MTPLERTLRRLVADLAASNFSYALVSGLAVSARAEPRLTRAADVAVSVRDDEEAEAVVESMVTMGYKPDIVTKHEPSGRIAAVRLKRSESDVVVDLLFASCGIEPEVVDAAETLEILPDLEVPVATLGHLIAMKLLAANDRARPVAAADVRSMLMVATTADIDVARQAVDHMINRGFHRGRELRRVLEGAVADRQEGKSY